MMVAPPKRIREFPIQRIKEILIRLLGQIRQVDLDSCSFG
jgi:hypothetical protein